MSSLSFSEKVASANGRMELGGSCCCCLGAGSLSGLGGPVQVLGACGRFIRVCRTGAVSYRTSVCGGARPTTPFLACALLCPSVPPSLVTSRKRTRKFYFGGLNRYQ